MFTAAWRPLARSSPAFQGLEQLAFLGDLFRRRQVGGITAPSQPNPLPPVYPSAFGLPSSHLFAQHLLLVHVVSPGFAFRFPASEPPANGMTHRSQQLARIVRRNGKKIGGERRLGVPFLGVVQRLVGGLDLLLDFPSFGKQIGNSIT